MRARPMWSPRDRRTKLAPRGGEFRPDCAPGRRRGGAGPGDPTPRRSGQRVRLDAAGASERLRGSRRRYWAKSGMQVPGGDVRPRVRDACLSGLKDLQGPRCKIPLGRVRVSGVHRAICGAPEAVSLCAGPGRGEGARGV